MSLSVFATADGGFRLYRGDEHVGWIDGRAVGFRGFESAREARRAARVAYEALRTWAARQRRGHLAPGRARGLATLQDGQLTWLTLGGVPVGRIVEPRGTALFDVLDGTSYGFELLLPSGVGAVATIGAAQVIDRVLARHATVQSATMTSCGNGETGPLDTQRHFSYLKAGMFDQHTLAARRAAPATVLALPPPPDARLRRTGVHASRTLRRILVATDGRRASWGALQVSSLLARRDGAAVDVLNVFERWGRPEPDPKMWDVLGDLIEDRLARVMDQAESAFGGSTGWTVSIVDGGVSSTISQVADSAGYDLVVLGLRRRWIDRLLRRFTALAVAHRTGVPVLAVPPTVTALPMRAVVGIDGRQSGTAASRAALDLLGMTASVHLVHVRSPDGSAAREPVGPDELLTQAERELAGSSAASIERTVVADHDPAAGLLGYATAVGADLIALATRKPASRARRLVGGVSRRILRSADCCVLLWPGG